MTTPALPFIVTVHRKPGGRRPVMQQYNFGDVGHANLQMDKIAADRDVVQCELSVVLKRVVYYSHLTNRRGTFDREKDR